jgi:hypothetical protein
MAAPRLAPRLDHRSTHLPTVTNEPPPPKHPRSATPRRLATSRRPCATGNRCGYPAARLARLESGRARPADADGPPVAGSLAHRQPACRSEPDAGPGQGTTRALPYQYRTQALDGRPHEGCPDRYPPSQSPAHLPSRHLQESDDRLPAQPRTSRPRHSPDLCPSPPTRRIHLTPIGWTITDAIVALSEWSKHHSADITRVRSEYWLQHLKPTRSFNPGSTRDRRSSRKIASLEPSL